MHWAKIDSFFKQACNCIGEKMVSFVVYGSVATGENREDSNIDLLILFNKWAHQQDLDILKGIVDIQNELGGPLLSVSVGKSGDFLIGIESGDEFSVSVASEGHCLLQSAVFRAAKKLIDVDIC